MEGVIKSLKSAGKIVYTAAGFSGETQWSDVFEDPENKLLDPLKAYLKDLGLDGIVLDSLGIYVSTPPLDYNVIHLQFCIFFFFKFSISK